MDSRHPGGMGNPLASAAWMEEGLDRWRSGMAYETRSGAADGAGQEEGELTAYSFQPQFVEPILAGTKRQTIRAHGRRSHVKPGGMIQLYTGMRTRACRKIRDDVVCTDIIPVRFFVMLGDPAQSDIWVDGRVLALEPREAFARADGFDSFADMVAFWLKTHGAILFEGVCIMWGEPDPAPARS